jgi:beta-lactamase regulating signal transducer with metallopeptidase domain/peroxiredoxin
MSERMVLIAEALGHWVLAWTLVLLAVMLWICALRPRRAAVRYAGWVLATFAGAALLPVVIVVGPRVSWSEVVGLIRTVSIVNVPSERPIAFRSWFADQPTSFRAELVTTFEDRSADRADSAWPSGRAEPISPKNNPRHRPLTDRWLLIALGVWAAGFLFFAARLCWSAVLIRTLLSKLEPTVPEQLDSELESSCRKLGIRRRVRVGTHPEIAAPMCVGLLRPVILWPTPENCPMSPRERLASLTHELAHLHHADDAVALLAEVWRALSWFYPPVHLAVVNLQREREYRCDDMAAAKLDTPEEYAQWLLDLAPVRISPPPPFLAASLLGGTSLADRVRRIVRGELKWSQPLSRRRWVILALLAFLMLGAAGSVRFVGFVGRAMADQPADAPLPEITPAQLAAKVREAMDRYDGKGVFRVVFTDTRDTNFNPNKPIMVSFRGRARYEGDGTRWRAEYDSMMPTSGTTRLWPDRWSTGFDGTQPYDWQVSRNEFILGESSFFAKQWTPRALIWERTEEMARELEDTRAKSSIAIKQRVVDGMRCYVIEGKSPDGEWGSETIVSTRQGYLPIERKWTHHGKTYSSYTLQGVHEVIPGIWAPDRMEYESTGIRADGASQLDTRRRIQIVEYRPRDVPPPATFAFEIPYGVDVTDRRLGSSYHNDPWWPEIGPMLRDKFGWPPPDFSPLTNLGSPSEKKLDGKEAPPLRVATWLNSEPLDLGALRGKVVLLEFWNVSTPFQRPIVPALRELYAVYHPAGLEIIAVDSPTRDPDELRRFIREYDIKYPVVIDAPGPALWGKTAETYGTRDGTYAFLIDPEGKVHSVGEPTANGGKIVETLVSLLKKSGARDVKPVSLEIARLPNEALNAAEALFRTKAKEALDADPKGRILGRIVNEQHQPIAGANIQATLHLTFLHMNMTGGYYDVDYRGHVERFTATSGTDGRFDLAGLCKGAYVLKVEAPGRAWAEKKVFIAPNLDPVSVEFVLDQKDAISGQVRDDRGQPVANATVTPTERHHGEEFQYSTRPAGLDPAMTNAMGQFRFTGIQQGRYTIEVKAPGFKDETIEKVPAGTENVTVTLKRSG